MFWLPFITVTAGILGGMCERALGDARGFWPWLLRVLLPAISGSVWFGLVDGMTSGHGREHAIFDWLSFGVFSVPAWVGVWAVRQSRRD